jgi:hypothetical protein
MSLETTVMTEKSLENADDEVDIIVSKSYYIIF